ncbi:hypothetical protein OIU84_001549 [Salix udensis]|uniref:DUF868 family protein n=1 Tax=Salix udensis TaxID=889485 RepID=A0AAD6K789_9ROSI|nr:hypothetical protein OIU84_001549 [Salix udensis]
MLDHPIGIPACFTSGEKVTDDPATVTRSGQSVFMSVYRTKIADQCRLITITWCKNLLLHGLSVSVEGPEGESHYTCKVELKPWYFWRKQGSKRFVVEGKAVDIFWDLKAAKFNGETEPNSEYYVAVVCDEVVVLLLGDLKKDAYRKTRVQACSYRSPFWFQERSTYLGRRSSLQEPSSMKKVGFMRSQSSARTDVITVAMLVTGILSMGMNQKWQ